MNLNINEWKEFKLTDAFIPKGGFYNKKPEHSENGDIPFLASTEANNGATEYYSLKDIKTWDKVGNIDNTLNNKIYEGNCIAVTVNGSVCNAFFQQGEFTCSHDITVLYPKNHTFTQNQALFICTVIMKEKYRWSYGRKPHDVKKFGQSIIKLPADKNGNPDWQFMENYVKFLNYKQITTKNKSYELPNIIANEWEEFYISDCEDHKGLFKIENCKCGYAGDLEDGTEINYIGAKKTDNGVMRKVIKDSKLISKGNGILFICDGEGSVGYANYMDKDYIGSTTTSIGYNRNLNKYNALFIVTLLDKEKYKFSYGRKYRAHINELKIKLPVAKDGNPDWVFMENYMKSLPYGDRI